MPEWFPGGCERRQVYRSHSRCVLRLASDTGLSTVRLPRKLRAAVPLRVVERTSPLAGVGRHGWVQTILPLGKTLQSEPMDTFETMVKISRGPDAMQLRDNRWRLNVYRWERAQDPRRAPIPRQLCGLKDWFPLDALPFDQTWDPSVVLQRRRTGRTNCSERQSGEIFSRGAPCIDVLRHLVALTWPTTADSDEGLQSRDVTVWHPTSRKKPHPTCEAWNEQDINGRLSPSFGERCRARPVGHCSFLGCKC